MTLEQSQVIVMAPKAVVSWRVALEESAQQTNWGWSLALDFLPLARGAGAGVSGRPAEAALEEEIEAVAGRFTHGAPLALCRADTLEARTFDAMGDEWRHIGDGRGR
jgi:hypothetical protein